MSQKEIRIVLFGKTGCGKSATGNTILGRDAFAKAGGLKSGTSECQFGRCEYGGYDVLVVDTPGFYDSAKPDETTTIEILKCFTMTSPGPHVFLWVLKANERFSNRDGDVFDIMVRLLGDNVKRYVILVFTHVDQFDGDFTQELSDPPSSLKPILDGVKRRYVVISNSSNTEAYTDELMAKVHELVKNRPSYFSNQLTDDVQVRVKHRIEEIKEKHNIDAEAAKEKFLEDLEKGQEKPFMTALFTAVGATVGTAVGGIGGGIAGALLGPAGSLAGVGLGATAGASVGLTVGAVAGHLVHKKCATVHKKCAIM